MVERMVLLMEKHTDLLKDILGIIPKFYQTKELATSYKKEADSFGSKIKKGMQELNLDHLEADGVEAIYSEREKESFNEPALIAYLKDLPADAKPDGLIKTVEVVDMDVLEAAVYNGKIEAAALQPFRTCVKIPTLRVKVKK